MKTHSEVLKKWNDLNDEIDQLSAEFASLPPDGKNQNLTRRGELLAKTSIISWVLL